MATTISVPPPSPTTVWRKSRHVTLDGGYLVADVQQESLYPILEAAHDGRALQALSDAHTDDAVCEFTKNWGFLHARFEGGRRDRFPLALFRAHQQFFLALARLCEAVRTRPYDREEITAALLALKTSRAERDAYLSANLSALTGERRLKESLTNAEQALADQGVPIFVLLGAGGEGSGTIDLAEYAARTVASELSAGLQYCLRPMWRATGKGRQDGYWTFEDIPIVFSLEQVLQWTFRSRYHVLHHYFCTGCGHEAISGRADVRFCSEACGTRVRVAQWRARKAAAKRKAARRSPSANRSTNRRARASMGRDARGRRGDRS